MSLPLGGEYSIAYSSVENNFALFLSEPIKRPLGVSHFERWGMEPLELETTIEKVVWNV